MIFLDISTFYKKGRWARVSSTEYYSKPSLGVVGFSSDMGLADYYRLGGFDFVSPCEDTAHADLSIDVTDDGWDKLQNALYEDTVQLKSNIGSLKFLAIATPSLELLSTEQKATLGLEAISLIKTVVAYCEKSNLKQVGILGTKWDMAETGPLIKALKQHGIQTWTPHDLTMREAISTCIVRAKKDNYINYQGRILKADDYFVEVIRTMLYECVKFMDSLLICNPELRKFIPRIRQVDRAHFAVAPIIDAPMLYWEQIRTMLWNHKNSPS